MSEEKQQKKGHVLLKVLRRTGLVLVTMVVLLVTGLCMVLGMVFRGPSRTARDVLTMSLTEASATKWIPGLFLGEETVTQIRSKVTTQLPDDVSEVSGVTIQKDSAVDNSDEWKDYPDGIRIQSLSGDTYNAYVMLIKDPSRVYMATSSNTFSTEIPGSRIQKKLEEEGASAAINAGAFFDDGTASSKVGSVPCGLVFAGGSCVWNDGTTYNGFVGLNQDDILVVARQMTQKQAEELNIRDGCCFGPVLIMNGVINEEAYNSNSGYNPRTCIGQREDGTIVLLCVDGRQAGSLGATYADLIDILVENNVVNACNLDGGSSTVMLYRDTYGLYGAAGEIQMINNYSLLQQEPRRMPTFFMIR